MPTSDLPTVGNSEVGISEGNLGHSGPRFFGINVIIQDLKE